MAQNCPKMKNLVVKPHSKRHQALLAMSRCFQGKKTFHLTSNLVIILQFCEVKVLEFFFHIFQMFVSNFSPFGLQIKNFFIAQEIIKK